jgi:hypothetical protein
MSCKVGQHDYDNAERHGRADIRCPACGDNITFELCLIDEAMAETEDRWSPT